MKNTAWIYLLAAGVLEIGWAYGLKLSEGFTQVIPSILTAAVLGCSFYLFAKAMKNIEIGTAYAVFTGIGTAGTVLLGMAVLGEPTDVWRLFFVTVLLGGIIGLKVIANAPAKAPEGGAG